MRRCFWGRWGGLRSCGMRRIRGEGEGGQGREKVVVELVGDSSCMFFLSFFNPKRDINTNRLQRITMMLLAYIIYWNNVFIKLLAATLSILVHSSATSTHSCGFQCHSCRFWCHSCGFWYHSCGFWWIPVEWLHSCRNVWGMIKYCL
jgi:hypothetical protein